MKDINNDELKNYGILIKNQVMDNGEKRFRLIGEDGSSYIRTETSQNSGWQNSHFHLRLKELYLVQKGNIILAQLINNRVNIQKYSEYEFFIIEPNISHNVYMYPNTIVHTIKFGDCTQSDWNEDRELDCLLENMEII